MTKTCTKCKKEKELSEFTKEKKGKYGVRSKCKECANKYTREYKKNNREKISEGNKKYRKRNHKKVKEYNKQYNKDNSSKRNKIYRDRSKRDPLFKMVNNIRRSIIRKLTISGYKKSSKTNKILGCSYEELMVWLSDKAGNNLVYGEGVHMDHVIPTSWARTEEEVIALNHYSNLQFLTKEDNLSKGNSPPREENYNRVLENHPNPDLIEAIFGTYETI